MFFRNATLLRFGDEVAHHEHTLGERFALLPLHEPGPQELATSGFLPPLRSGNDTDFIRRCGRAALFCVGQRMRMLPPDVVAEDTKRRVDDISAKTGRRVGSKEFKQIREEVTTELLPRAFVRQTRTYAYLDLAGGWLVIDTASAKAGQVVIDEVRKALGTFRCTPLTPEEPPRIVMTDWVIRGEVPTDLALGGECDLADPGEGGSKWNGRRVELETEEVREHLRSGMQVMRLGLTYAERLSFVLGEDLVLRKLRFLESALDDLGEPEDAEAELDARFALMRLELERLLAVMTTTFAIPREGKLVLDGGAAPKALRESVRGAVQSLEKLLGEDNASATIEDDKGNVIASFGSVTVKTIPRDADGNIDELLNEAIAHVRASKRASIASLQRHLKIGYNRAARLIETLEEMSVVSAPAPNGVRTVLFLGAQP